MIAAFNEEGRCLFIIIIIRGWYEGRAGQDSVVWGRRASGKDKSDWTALKGVAFAGVM